MIGKAHKNPLLDTSMYDVTFMDGITEAFTANTIAVAIYSQIDDEGKEFNILADITDHKKGNDALQGNDLFVLHNGKKYPKRTTKGWLMNVEWRDGSTSWMRLAYLKESNPIEVAEYALANKLLNEPAFVWWAPYVLKKRQHIISKIKTRYFRKEQKFGIPLPKTVQEAYSSIDSRLQRTGSMRLRKRWVSFFRQLRFWVMA